jgi:hypothetical protein
MLDKIPNDFLFNINTNGILNINDLKTKKEVLIWYLEMNSDGTPHTEQELNKVKNMIEKIKIIK